MLSIRTRLVSYLAIIDGSISLKLDKYLETPRYITNPTIKKFNGLIDLVMRILRALCSSYRVLTLYTKERVVVTAIMLPMLSYSMCYVGTMSIM